MSTSLTKAQLTGLDDSHLALAGSTDILAHHEATSALSSMMTHAQRDGINLQPASGYRDFSRQKAIWDAKLTGKRPLLDAHSDPLELLGLTAEQKLDALLYWSAIPGTSRHHWGSDFDFYDPIAQGDKPFQLIPAEYAPGGPQHSTFQWLRTHAISYGFFWPYDKARGGVAIEPWHLSYADVAEPALSAMTPALIAELLSHHPIELADQVIKRLDELLDRYVFNVNRWNTIR
ncbi:M15 family metallopeptidase [Corallincola platygyrae]|uniref:M15 family metallopeptidase n=1 Tax=Corallincola platygyrae TaxID=1193278 RepID=A0ABW4XT55_9GAMM